MSTVCRHFAVFGLLCGLFWGEEKPTAKPTNIDVVVMKNGDRLSGEIKRIEHGLLYLEAPYISGEQVAVDWLQVERIDSVRRFRVELDNGARLTGQVSLATSSESGRSEFSIQSGGQTVRAPRESVVEMGTQKPNFFRQLKGNIDFGYSYTSGNDQVQGNFDATSKFESPTYLIEGQIDSTISLVSGANETNRQQLTTLLGRYFSKQDLLFAGADFLSSNQQRLDLRATFAGGYGRSFIKTPRTELTLLAGLAYNHERYDASAGQLPSHDSAESLFALRYSTFRFNRTEFSNGLQVIPSLSDPGRVRSNLNSAFTLKLVNNLHFQVNLWDTFDSQPPIKAKKNELGVSSGLGWTY